jgi:hypothetical protein
LRDVDVQLVKDVERDITECTYGDLAGRSAGTATHIHLVGLVLKSPFEDDISVLVVGFRGQV